jgi:pSer/pThr/pTyr-binding forkhead associated (FHA) protein
MWKLRIDDDQSNRTVVNLVRQQYTLGRAEENSVRLTERNVSRKHATLERSGDGWLLEDLDSYTGTTVGDQRVRGRVSLGHGSAIRIGDYTVLLYDDALELEQSPVRDAMTVPAPLPSDPPAVPVDRLIVIDGPNPGAEYALGERRLLIGRGEECDIALNDTSVSRVHADIERDDSGRFRIGDLQSSNGVRVNGMEIQSTTLYSGDLVELGDVQLQFVPKGQTFTLSDHPRSGASGAGFWRQLTPVQRWAAVGGSGAVLVTALAWSMASSDALVARSAGNEATRALDLGRKQFERGEFSAAHAAVKDIPPGSNLRQSSMFRRIESAWADELLDAAERTDNVDAQRQLLDRVARAESVDSVRRRRALDQLAQLNATSLDPADLPQAMEDDAGAQDAELQPDEPEQPTQPAAAVEPRPKVVVTGPAEPEPETKPRVKAAPRPAVELPRPATTQAVISAKEGGSAATPNQGTIVIQPSSPPVEQVAPPPDPAPPQP